MNRNGPNKSGNGPNRSGNGRTTWNVNFAKPKKKLADSLLEIDPKERHAQILRGRVKWSAGK